MKQNSNIEIARRFASLPVEKQHAFLKILQDKGIDFAQLPIMKRQEATRSMASYAQARQWFLWQMDPYGTQYHIRGGLTLNGNLCADVIDKSLKDLLVRHPALGSVFVFNEAGDLETRLIELDEISVQRFDFTDLENDAASAVRHAALSFTLAPFDLQQGPLLRVALLQEKTDRHVLLMVLHHSVADGWSLQIIFDELSRFYAGYVSGHVYKPPQPEIEYADYAAWQRQWLEAGEKQRQLAYWKAYLGATQPVMQIPADRPRRADARYTREQRRLVMPESLMASLRRCSDMRRVTLFTMFLAALHVLLHRYSNQQDVRIGVPIANRHKREVQGIVGLFVNTQVMRCVFDGPTTLDEVLKSVHDSVTGARLAQDLPFEELVDALHPARDHGTNPLFQVLMNYQHDDDRALQELPGLSVHPYEIGGNATQFELTFDITERSHTDVALTINYAAELFAGAFIDRMSGHYLSILNMVIATPEARVDRIELMAPREEQVVRQWGTGRLFSSELRPVHASFEERSRLSPAAVAVMFDAEAMTYGELNVKANRLAHYLIDAGVRPETKVGVALARSFELIVAVLAVLKAGGTFVPLDPASPVDRFSFMVSQSDVRIVLAQGQQLARTTAQAGSSLVAIDQLALSHYPTSEPLLEIRGANLAYVIYTSGSTGQPKGVSISHDSLAVCMQWMIDTFSVSSDDTILHKASFSFDVSMWEMFLPLTSGARLLVANPGDQADPARIAALIFEHNVTVMNFVPSMLHAFLQHDGFKTITTLRHIMIGGEAVTATLRNEALKSLAGVGLHNLYGPTETTIHVTMGTCQDEGLSTVPIGSPIAATQAYVLGLELETIPPGLIGELYIGGALLARGYLNRPTLTADRFVANPFEPGGGRLYRTGDLVRWSEHGQLEYLGRVDQQVKIRGRRIELAEVEARLLDHADIQEAVVVAAEGAAGARLLAYVTCAERSVDQQQLRKWCARFLPGYMVPDAVMVLDALPLNANGKVDRKALPAVVIVEPDLYEPPLAGMEQAMAAIWAEVLGLERVSRHANFFELGGHSLLALRLLHKLNNKWPELALTLQRLFAEPTIAALSNVAPVRQSYSKLNMCNLDHAPLIVIHDGWGSVLDYTTVARSLEGTCPVYGVTFDASSSDTVSPGSLADLADRHCEAILEMGLPSGYRLAGWSLGGALALMIAASLEQRGCSVEFVGVVDPFVPGDVNLSKLTLRDELRQFFAVLIPAASRRLFDDDPTLSMHLANVSDDRAVLSLIGEVLARLSAADLHEYAAVGPVGLMSMFITARVLQTAALAPCKAVSTQVPVQVWWSDSSLSTDRQRFGTWASLVSVEEHVVHADHLGIIRSSQVASAWKAALRKKKGAN